MHDLRAIEEELTSLKGERTARGPIGRLAGVGDRISWQNTRTAQLEITRFSHRCQAGILFPPLSPTWQKQHKIYLQSITKKEGHAWHRRQEATWICLTEAQYVIHQIQCFQLLKRIICLPVIHWGRQYCFSFTPALIPLPLTYLFFSLEQVWSVSYDLYCNKWLKNDYNQEKAVNIANHNSLTSESKAIA